jgi:hypothetical protein
MIKIAFPQKPFKTRTESGSEQIFDGIRKRWLVLTPEEWVRQNMLQYLASIHYPLSLIAVEKEIFLGEMKKRCDIVVYDRSGNPWMIIECKEMNVKLNAAVLDQVLRYHISIPCPYLIITNGRYCYGFEKKNGELVEMNSFPVFPVG